MTTCTNSRFIPTNCGSIICPILGQRGLLFDVSITQNKCSFWFYLGHNDQHEMPAFYLISHDRINNIQSPYNNTKCLISNVPEPYNTIIIATAQYYDNVQHTNITQELMSSLY